MGDCSREVISLWPLLCVSADCMASRCSDPTAPSRGRSTLIPALLQRGHPCVSTPIGCPCNPYSVHTSAMAEATPDNHNHAPPWRPFLVTPWRNQKMPIPDYPTSVLVTTSMLCGSAIWPSRFKITDIICLQGSCSSSLAPQANMDGDAAHTERVQTMGEA